jgi:hypothetical protein
VALFFAHFSYCTGTARHEKLLRREGAEPTKG